MADFKKIFEGRCRQILFPDLVCKLWRWEEILMPCLRSFATLGHSRPEISPIFEYCRMHWQRRDTACFFAHHLHSSLFHEVQSA